MALDLALGLSLDLDLGPVGLLGHAAIGNGSLDKMELRPLFVALGPVSDRLS